MTTRAERVAVLVELHDLADPGAEVVVSAVAQLFEAGDPVDVVMWVPGIAVAEAAEVVTGWVLDAVDDPERLPGIDLVEDAEVEDRRYLARISTRGGARQVARAVALLTGVATSVPAVGDAPPSSGAAQVPRTARPPRPASGDGLEHAVFLSSYGGVAVACSPLALARELAGVEHDAVRYVLVEDLSTAVPVGAVPVLRGSPDHLRALTRSRWVVDNQEMPAGFVKSPGQVLVQTWHGTPLKKLYRDQHAVAPGSEAALTERLRDAAQWDYVVSPNPFTSEVLENGFGVRGTLLEHGYPRNDVLADPRRREEENRRVRSALGIPLGSRVVTYAPTWRDDALVGWGSGASYREQPTLDWAALEAEAGQDVTFLSRRHRALPAHEGPGSGRVLDVSGWPDMNELLAATDVLVTDYSSAFFDFACTGRPMVFFAYDLEEYRGRTRGHYFAMEDVVPGPVVDQVEEATEAVVRAALDPDGERERFADRYRPFVDRFNPWDDGAAARRVVEAVFL